MYGGQLSYWQPICRFSRPSQICKEMREGFLCVRVSLVNLHMRHFVSMVDNYRSGNQSTGARERLKFAERWECFCNAFGFCPVRVKILTATLKRRTAIKSRYLYTCVILCLWWIIVALAINPPVLGTILNFQRSESVLFSRDESLTSATFQTKNINKSAVRLHQRQ